MLCTFTEAYKCLGFKSRASIYQLKDKGILDPYIRRINDKKYLYMGLIHGRLGKNKFNLLYFKL